MSEVQSGLEGVVAFATEIAEPDKEGGALRYRGVNIEELVGRVPFEQVWGLLVDGALKPGPPPAEADPPARRPGDPRRGGPAPPPPRACAGGRRGRGSGRSGASSR